MGSAVGTPPPFPSLLPNASLFVEMASSASNALMPVVEPLVAERNASLNEKMLDVV